MSLRDWREMETESKRMKKKGIRGREWKGESVRAKSRENRSADKKEGKVFCFILLFIFYLLTFNFVEITKSVILF